MAGNIQEGVRANRVLMNIGRLQQAAILSARGASRRASQAQWWVFRVADGRTPRKTHFSFSTRRINPLEWYSHVIWYSEGEWELRAVRSCFCTAPPAPTIRSITDVGHDWCL